MKRIAKILDALFWVSIAVIMTGVICLLVYYSGGVR